VAQKKQRQDRRRRQKLQGTGNSRDIRHRMLAINFGRSL
jgi:hypothetical protein